MDCTPSSCSHGDVTHLFVNCCKEVCNYDFNISVCLEPEVIVFGEDDGAGELLLIEQKYASSRANSCLFLVLYSKDHQHNDQKCFG